MITTVQSQQWTGTFKTDSTCSTIFCCCLNGQVVVTQPSTSILAMTSGLSGQCSGQTTFSTTTPYPSGYSGYVTVYGQNLTLTLSSNSDTISAVNPLNSACDGNAYRSIAIKQFGNIMTIVALLFIGQTKIVF